MELTAQQLAKLRVPFEQVGAFKGLSEDEIRKILEGVAEFYTTLAKINLRLKKESSTKNGK
ncbi:MAG TPA: hypothetical protein VJJ24_00380 [Candidatus Paceibacterota bacterium]